MLGTVSKQLDVAGLAVGVVAVLLERAFVKQLETEGTLEVVRMPLPAHRSDTFACCVCVCVRVCVCGGGGRTRILPCS